MTLSSDSFSFMNNLSDDLLIKILLLLSPQFAVQCKSVCKRWLFLISNPWFVHHSVHIHQHEQSHNPSFSLIIQRINREFRYLHEAISTNPTMIKLHASDRGEFRYLREAISTNPSMIKLHASDGGSQVLNLFPYPTYIVAYFNDLVVCCVQSQNLHIYICNLLTGQFLMLPPPPKCQEDAMLGFVCYPFPCHKNQACTINYVQYSYKLVCIRNFQGYKTKVNVDTFCSKTGKWSESVVLSHKKLNGINQTGMVAYNGILHWIDEDKNIVTYNPLESKFRVIASSMYAEPEFVTVERIGVCGGKLMVCQLVSYYPLHECVYTKLCMWELEDYNAGRWSREEIVRLRDLDSERLLDGEVSDLSRRHPRAVLLGLHPFNEKIVFMSFSDRIMECDLGTRLLKEVDKVQYDNGGLMCLYGGGCGCVPACASAMANAGSSSSASRYIVALDVVYMASILKA